MKPHVSGTPAVRKALTEINYAGSAIVEFEGGDEAYLRDVNRRLNQLLLGNPGNRNTDFPLENRHFYITPETLTWRSNGLANVAGNRVDICNTHGCHLGTELKNPFQRCRAAVRTVDS